MSKSNAVRLGSDSLAAAQSHSGSDSLAAARSHSGSDSHPRLSFIALVPLRYATGASFTTEPVRIHYLKKQSGFEFSRLDAARSGSALTRHRRLIHYRARSNPYRKAKEHPLGALLFWRKDRDSNPSWGISPNTISSRAP